MIWTIPVLNFLKMTKTFKTKKKKTLKATFLYA